MEEFLEWIFDNKEWLFSGVGLTVVGWLVRVIFMKRQASSTQSIVSGDSSKNVQAGRDVSIRTKKRNDVE